MYQLDLESVNYKTQGGSGKTPRYTLPSGVRANGTLLIDSMRTHYEALKQVENKIAASVERTVTRNVAEQIDAAIAKVLAKGNAVSYAAVTAEAAPQRRTALTTEVTPGGSPNMRGGTNLKTRGKPSPANKGNKPRQKTPLASSATGSQPPLPAENGKRSGRRTPTTELAEDSKKLDLDILCI